MNYAIIAAGDGSRLAQEGVARPKPLIELNGETMIDRLIRIFLANGATTISIIVNEKMPEVAQHLRSITLPIPLNIVETYTPSSMHSFYALTEAMPEGKFCLTTVDTIFQEDDFSKFIQMFQSTSDVAGLFAVTAFIDDEKPLYVEVDDNDMIISFKDEDYEGSKYISGGIYCLDERALPILKHQIDTGNARMRNYQRALVNSGLEIKAYPFDKIIDVDHAADIDTAIKMLNLY